MRHWRAITFELLVSVAVSGLAGCTVPAPVCSYPGSRPMLVVELFFGRGLAPAGPGQPPGTVSDAEWAAFAETVLTPAFPDGLTAWNADGQWRNPATGSIVRDPTKVVLIAAPDGAATRNAIDRVSAQYRTRFDQQSVGVILSSDCAAF
jgi:Protein of unknown function (DUF3574)